MRTTIEFAPDLIRAAKARSAELGESLKALLTRAVAAELGRPVTPMHRGARMVLPVFGSAVGPRANVSSADLERALADVDAESIRGAAIRSPRPTPRRRS